MQSTGAEIQKDQALSRVRTTYYPQGAALLGRAARKKDKAIRRARVAIMAEAIDPIAVCERDGWQCHLCGIDTPKELRGSSDPRAPEIDHVHPLALGGSHIWSNVRCACRRCNGMKGAKTMEEFIQLPRGGGSNIQARSSRKQIGRAHV